MAVVERSPTEARFGQAPKERLIARRIKYARSRVSERKQRDRPAYLIRGTAVECVGVEIACYNSRAGGKMIEQKSHLNTAAVCCAEHFKVAVGNRYDASSTAVDPQD